MREIKFRGMRLNGEWAYGLLSISQGYPGQPKIGYYISNSCGMPWAYSVRPETVGQYTGLKDKNDMAICKGDILGLDGGGEILAFPVEYEDGCFGIRTNGKDIAELKYYIDMSFVDMEIIGNIHENSELLKG